MSNYFTYWTDPDLEQEELSAVVWETLDGIIEEQKDLRARWLEQVNFYLDSEVAYDDMGFLPMDLEGEVDTDDAKTSTDHVSWNMLRSLTGALVSNVTLHNPAPKAQTKNAKEVTQMRIRKLNRFGLAGLRAMDYYGHQQRKMRLAAVMGTGFNRFFKEDGVVRTRVLRPDQVVVNNKACSPGETPPEIYHHDLIDRATLLSMFAGKEHARARTVINETKSALQDCRTRDMVEVCEAFSRPRFGTPGRRAFVTREGFLVSEKFDRPRYPINWTKYEEPLSGFYGESLIGPVLSCQRQINYILQEARGNMRHLGVAYLEGQRRPDDDDDMADQELLDTEKYKLLDQGAKVVLPGFINPQFLELLNMNVAKMFEITGLNTLMAHGTVPPGLAAASGVAQREWRDSGSMRLSEASKALEHDVVEAMYITMDIGAEIDAADEWKVEDESGDLVDSIAWKDIGTGFDAVSWSVQPASSLAQSPASRMADIYDAMDRGLLDPEEGKQLLGWSDLAKQRELDSAPRDNLEWTFESMLDDGKYREPKEYQDLILGRKMCLQYLNRAQQTDAKHADLLELWLDASAEIITAREDAQRRKEAEARAQEQAEQQQMAPQPAMPGNGQAPVDVAAMMPEGVAPEMGG